MGAPSSPATAKPIKAPRGCGTPLQCIRAAQEERNSECQVRSNPISALVVEGYWLDFEQEGLEQPHRSVLLLTDFCGYHTFYDYDRDDDGNAVIVREGHGRPADRVIYRPITPMNPWLEIWLEKVEVVEAAREAFESIDWDGWERWRAARGATEEEAVAEALREAGVSFTLTVLDVSPLFDREERRDEIPERRTWPVRYAESRDVRVFTAFDHETLAEAIDHQWNILGRAFEQNSVHMGAGLAVGEADGPRLPRLPAGGYDEAESPGPCAICNPLAEWCEICGDGPTKPARWVRFGPGHLPLPVQY